MNATFSGSSWAVADEATRSVRSAIRIVRMDVPPECGRETGWDGRGCRGRARRDGGPRGGSSLAASVRLAQRFGGAERAVALAERGERQREDREQVRHHRQQLRWEPVLQAEAEREERAEQQR